MAKGDKYRVTKIVYGRVSLAEFGLDVGDVVYVGNTTDYCDGTHVEHLFSKDKPLHIDVGSIVLRECFEPIK